MFLFLSPPYSFSELLLLIKLLLTRFPSLPNPSVADIKSIAQHIGSSDKDVHRAAIDCIIVARGTYTTEQISTMAGNVSTSNFMMLGLLLLLLYS